MREMTCLDGSNDGSSSEKDPFIVFKAIQERFKYISPGLRTIKSYTSQTSISEISALIQFFFSSPTRN